MDEYIQYDRRNADSSTDAIRTLIALVIGHKTLNRHLAAIRDDEHPDYHNPSVRRITMRFETCP